MQRRKPEDMEKVEETEAPVEDDKENNSEENEVFQSQKVKQNLFEKQGKLRRDF